MKLLKIAALWAVSLLVAVPVRAQIPAAEQLLPDDTIAVVTVPDWNKLAGYYKQSPYSQLWDDPAMKPFREKFVAKFKSDIAEPLERELGAKLTDYKDLLQGQVTIALTPPREGSKDPLGLLIMLDSKDKSEQLKTRLADLKKKWTDSGKETKTEKIRDTDFSVITISDEDWKNFMKKAFPKSASEEEEEEEEEGEEKSEPTQLHIGQFKSLLLIAENPKTIEKIIAKQSGGIVPTLSEQAAFQKNFAARFRDSLGFAWLNWKPLYQMLMDQLVKAQQEAPPEGIPGMSPDKLFPALGFAGLEGISFNFNGGNDGGSGEFFVAVPEAQREGIFKILALEKKDATPPPFIPADAVQFQRWRLNVPKAWDALEAALAKIEPSFAATITMMLNQVGKEKDPSFDFKRSFIGNIGDDLISFQKAPKSMKASELVSPPSLFLVGSSQPEQLLETFKTLSLLMPPPFGGEPPKEREFLGKKIYTLSATVPDFEEAGDENQPPPEKTHSLHFSSSGGYIAFSSDAALIEEYLRSGEAGGKPLRETPGLAQAAQKIGGMDGGFFGFENQRETMRYTLEIIKQDEEGLRRLFLPGGININSSNEGEGSEGGLKSWFDYTLLPNYDAVAKYFHIAVYNGTITPDGFSFKFFGPTPPELKK